MATITCDCSTALVNLPNQACDSLGLSPIIAWMAVQKMSGSNFDGAAITGTTGGDINLEADWVAKMAATDDDKITVIGIVQAMVTNEAEDQIDDTSDPYGGRRVVSRSRSYAGRLDYPAAQTITGVNTFNKCVDKLRVWMLDAADNLQEFENMNIIFGQLQRPGRGQNIPAHFPFTLSGGAIEEPDFITPTSDFAFLSALANV